MKTLVRCDTCGKPCDLDTAHIDRDDEITCQQCVRDFLAEPVRYRPAPRPISAGCDPEYPFEPLPPSFAVANWVAPAVVALCISYCIARAFGILP